MASGLNRNIELAPVGSSSRTPAQYLLGGTTYAMRLIQVAMILAVFACLSAFALAESGTADSVSAGCSGGFTGGGSGAIIRRDGLILRWSRPTYRDAVEETILRSDPEEARSVFTQLDQMNFSSISYSKPGNMTCSVTFRQGPSSHAVSWEPGDPMAPSPVVDLAWRLQRLAWPVDSN